MLYELVIGLPPYYSRDTNEIYNAIISEKLKFPENTHISSDLKHLLFGLLAKDPNKRIGLRGGIEEILAHPWFKIVDLNAISKK